MSITTQLASLSLALAAVVSVSSPSFAKAGNFGAKFVCSTIVYSLSESGTDSDEGNLADCVQASQDLAADGISSPWEQARSLCPRAAEFSTNDEDAKSALIKGCFKAVHDKLSKK